MSAAGPCAPGAGFLDAETGPAKSPPETTYARRDQKDPKLVAQIPAQAAYLNLTGNYPVRKDWMVEVIGLKLVTHHPVIEPVSAPAPGMEISYAETGSQNPTFRLTETDAETAALATFSPE